MGKKPEWKVLVSRDNNGKNYYQEIGSGWDVDKNGISIQLNSLPIDGRCVLFPRDKDDRD